MDGVPQTNHQEDDASRAVTATFGSNGAKSLVNVDHFRGVAGRARDIVEALSQGLTFGV